MYKNLWLVGAGAMSQAYAAVLKDQRVSFSVIGRGRDSAEAFEAATGAPVLLGGLASALNVHGKPEAAIVSTPVDQLASNCHELLAAGVKRILVEKPAGLNPEETRSLANAARKADCQLFVGYNRRFYASTIKAMEMVAADGGPTSMRLEFSEASFRIADLPTPERVKSNWLYANSTHVLDMGFFIGGFPKSLHAQTGGALDWHPAGAQFVGHGTTETGVPFSYFADWDAAPRWMIEIGTRGRTFMFQPLEKLKYRDWTGFAEVQVELEDDLDARFKPGLWRQTQAFLEGKSTNSGLCGIAEHAAHMETVYKSILEGLEVPQ